ncbi:hypothetical protein BS47DRAFT_1388762 [Hydnum rufescens UP504]|uniref:Uncharacterized protein n=1 Tax=Hydnum rufescens UP504 TaxID=1448309 RepID=A0A9P6E183_9AGAM|nr:hypothetical protein BS47DRAFT_1388762 [Hydnum rufescens UP504]
MANAMLGIESSGSDADADWDPTISTGGKDLSNGEHFSDANSAEDVHVQYMGKEPSPVCSVAKKASPGPCGHGGRFSQAQLDKKLKKTPSGLRKGVAIIHQHLQPTYVKLHDELGGPSSEACHEHRNTLIDDLSTEKASDTAHIAMSGGDVAHQMALSQSKIDSEGQALHQIGVHLIYLMVSDLTSSTAAHGQNSINFNSKELRAWVDHEWNSCDLLK